MFAVGQRPTVDEFERLLASPELSGSGACVSYRPDNDEGWAELLIGGLTFDVLGLAPGDPNPVTAPAFRFGLPESDGEERLEPVRIVPGEHIAGGAASPPIVRALVGLVANIALPLGASAICWNPAQIWMEPGYFVRVTMNWLAGGAFPALGLTAMERFEDGHVATCGLAYFAGQEIHLEPGIDEAPADSMKLAIRLVDYMVRHGRMDNPRQLEGMAGETLYAEPAESGNVVYVRRRE